MQTVLFNQQVISHCDREREGIYRDAGHITKHHGSYSDVVVDSGKLYEIKQSLVVGSIREKIFKNIHKLRIQSMWKGELGVTYF